MKSDSTELAYRIVSILNDADHIQADAAISIAQVMLSERYVAALKDELDARISA
jgi:hypothetical protein